VSTKGTSIESLGINLEELSLSGSEDVSETASDTDTEEDNAEEARTMKQLDVASEFGDTEFEELVLKEGPAQILQLTLQDRTDEFMKEEISDSDDYADWIQWVSDAEKRRMYSREAEKLVEVPTMLQTHPSAKDEEPPNQATSSAACSDMSTRWEQISQRIQIDSDLGEERKQQLWKMIGSYQDVFAWNKKELGCCTIGEHCIDTQGFPPCNMTPGRLSFWEETEVKRQIDELVDLGKMKPSNSEYACRVTLPIKKDGSRRFCGDYRPLNAQTRRDMFPMPLVEDVIDQLGKSTWFTTLDLQSGFWQIRMSSEDVKKTALITKTGLYDWTVMPFGLKNATSTFSRTMAEVFKDLGSRFLKVFVDDLNIHSESWGEHLRHLDKVLCRLREVNLKLNPNKCCFAKKAITFLGHMVNKEGIQPDPGKIQAVLHFPPPRNVTNVRSFLGLTGYYRKYVKGYSTVAGPLFALTRKDVAFVWDVNCEQAYHTLKTALVNAPILTRPDFKRTFWLDVDWSPKGVGAILSQKDGKFERVVAYASKSLTEAQRKFHPMEGECYALIWGVMHFR
jgi:hypothetical protein